MLKARGRDDLRSVVCAANALQRRRLHRPARELFQRPSLGGVPRAPLPQAGSADLEHRGPVRVVRGMNALADKAAALLALHAAPEILRVWVGAAFMKDSLSIRDDLQRLPERTRSRCGKRDSGGDSLTRP